MKRRKNKEINSICSKINAANVYFTICVVVFIYAFTTPILALLLKRYGNQTEAIITPNTSTWLHRWSESCYMYEFCLDGHVYTGNSLIKDENSEKVGEKIEIYYFKICPYFNRPASYYDDTH